MLHGNFGREALQGGAGHSLVRLHAPGPTKNQEHRYQPRACHGPGGVQPKVPRAPGAAGTILKPIRHRPQNKIQLAKFISSRFGGKFHPSDRLLNF